MQNRRTRFTFRPDAGGARPGDRSGPALPGTTSLVGVQKAGRVCPRPVCARLLPARPGYILEQVVRPPARNPSKTYSSSAHRFPTKLRSPIPRKPKPTREKATLLSLLLPCGTMRRGDVHTQVSRDMSAIPVKPRREHPAQLSSVNVGTTFIRITENLWKSVFYNRRRR